jgi:hypothetical protein
MVILRVNKVYFFQELTKVVPQMCYNLFMLERNII